MNIKKSLLETKETYGIETQRNRLQVQKSASKTCQKRHLLKCLFLSKQPRALRVTSSANEVSSISQLPVVNLTSWLSHQALKSLNFYSSYILCVSVSYLPVEISVAPHLTTPVKNNSFHVCVVLSYCGDKNLEELNTLLSSDLGGFEKCSVNKTGS